MKETDILKLCMIRASKLGCTVWRNNSGMLYNKQGTPVKYGLCTGSADLIGFTPEGRFLALEIKVPSKSPTEKQQIFLDAVTKGGGVAGVARHPDDVDKIINNA